MPDEVPTAEEVRAFARVWWLPVALGLLSIVAGIIVVTKPDNSLKALAVIIGIFVLIDGIVELVMSLIGHGENRGTVALLGILNLVIGVLLIRHPIAGVQAVALLIGLWLVAAGVIRMIIAFDTHGDRLGRVLIAGVEILAGIVIVASDRIGYATLAVIVGISFIANGFGMLAFGILMRSVKHQQVTR